jgi:hypothetical protein
MLYDTDTRRQLCQDRVATLAAEYRRAQPPPPRGPEPVANFTLAQHTLSLLRRLRPKHARHTPALPRAT